MRRRILEAMISPIVETLITLRRTFAAVALVAAAIVTAAGQTPHSPTPAQARPQGQARRRRRPSAKARGSRSRWTRTAPGSSTCRRTRRTSRSAPTTSADIDGREAAEARYPELCKGIIDFQKVSYRSSVGDLDIPAYLFQPLQKRGPKGHAAMVWVHGGVHGNWGLTMFPFVKEAVERGYVVIAPDYRGSTGYGEAYHQAIDYGGYEVDDVDVGGRTT